MAPKNFKIAVFFAPSCTKNGFKKWLIFALSRPKMHFIKKILHFDIVSSVLFKIVAKILKNFAKFFEKIVKNR